MGPVQAGPRPFVGRAEELSLARAHAADAAQGRGSVLVVTGPAGIGKTQLVEEVLRLPAASGGTTQALGRGYCLADRSALPLWPWLQALRAIVRRTGGDPRCVAASAACRRSVGGHLPADAGDAAAARLARLAAIADAVLDAAAHQPLTLVVEHLQWADPDSLEALRLVAAGVRDSRLLVLATARDATPKDPALNDLERLPAVIVLPVPPLDAVGVALYAAEVTGAAVPAAVRDRVLSASGGLPLLLDAALVAVDGDPPGLPDITAGLLEALPPTARQVVEVTALLRPPVAAELVATVAGLSIGAASNALRTACRAGLLAPSAAYDGVEQPAFRVTGELLAAGLVAGVDPVRRRLMHRRAALALQGRSGSALDHDAAEVAAHWQQAGGDARTQRSRRSGERARTRRSWRRRRWTWLEATTCPESWWRHSS